MFVSLKCKKYFISRWMQKQRNRNQKVDYSYKTNQKSPPIVYKNSIFCFSSSLLTHIVIKYFEFPPIFLRLQFTFQHFISLKAWAVFLFFFLILFVFRKAYCSGDLWALSRLNSFSCNLFHLQFTTTRKLLSEYVCFSLFGCCCFYYHHSVRFG